MDVDSSEAALWTENMRLKSENEQLWSALKEISYRTTMLLHQNTGRWDMSLEHDRRTVGVLDGNLTIIRKALGKNDDV